MPEKLLITILPVSLAVGIVILFLKLLSAFLREKIAAKWKNWIWLFLAVRLILPVNVSLPATSIAVRMPNLQLSSAVNDSPAQTTGDAGMMPSRQETVVGQSEDAASYGGTPASVTLAEAAMIIWLLGCCCFLAYQIVGYQVFRKRILRWSQAPTNPQIADALCAAASEMGIRRDIAVLISGGAASPLMIGFIKPKLILPREDYSENDLTFILRHELTHYHRNDLWYKLLLVFATAVHWFNPLVWLMFGEANADLEMSCDDEVMRGIDFDGRKAYSEMILTSIDRQKVQQTALTTSFNGGKKALKSRFLNILTMKHKKNGALVLVLVFLAVGVLGALMGCTTGNTEPSGTDTPTAAVSGTGPFVGYVKDASADTFDVYTEESGTYLMSLPLSLFDDFPANDWKPGWMDIDVYCGSIDNFTWAVVCTSPSAGTGNENVCTSSDSGKTWWVGDRSAMYSGTVTGAGFVSSKVGFMSYRYFVDHGPEISRTLDGGKTWERMTVDVPEDLKEYKMTPLIPTFTGALGNYPIELYDSDGKPSVAYLTTEDGGMTWKWKGNALDEAVKAAFLNDSKNQYLSGECPGEGHIILGHDEKSGITTVYALTMYGEYGFEDGNFVKVSGSGVIPAVFTFSDSENGLICTKIEYPEDGSEYEKSIKRLFPSEYQDRVLRLSDRDAQDLTAQERSYAADYLKKIGRDAVIGNYGDFQHTLLTDAGVSVEVSNTTCGPLYSNYPMWIGNREALENGVRYVYETSYHKEAHEIDFTKYEYDTQKIVERMRLDSVTGLQVK